jgi:hypothetical protein
MENQEPETESGMRIPKEEPGQQVGGGENGDEQGTGSWSGLASYESFLAKVDQYRLKEDENPYKCSQCTKAFAKPVSLKIHMTSHNKQKALLSRPRKKKTEDEESWRPESAMGREDEKTASCAVSSSEEKEKEEEKQDQDQKEVSRRTSACKELHSCLHCDRVFAQQRSLKIHLATHRRKSLSRLPVTCEENTSTTARPVVPVARPVVHSPQQHVRSSTRLRLKKRRIYSNSPDITGSESEYEEEETMRVEKRGKENRNKANDGQPRNAGANVEAKERLEYQEAGNACSGEALGERTEEMDAKTGRLSRKRSPGFKQSGLSSFEAFIANVDQHRLQEVLESGTDTENSDDDRV